MKIAIKAVIFDYGKVLSQPQHDSDIEAMATTCGLPRQSFESLYWQYRPAYDEGHLDGRGYWQAIAEQSNQTFAEDKLLTLIKLDGESWSRPNEPTLQWAEELRKHGLLTPILSNMPYDVGKYVKRCTWISDFKPSIYSCDIGCMKPDRAIYEHCLKLLRLPAEQTLFLDDREENVEGARQLGIHSVCFATLEQATKETADKFALPLSAAAQTADMFSAS